MRRKKMECLFCKIINNEVNSYTLFEDNTLKIIMDAFPNSPGHILILPKEHYVDLSDIDEEVLKKIILKAKEYKKVIEEKLNPESIVLVQNNGKAQEIKHFHMHLIPYYKEKPTKTVEEMYEILKG